MSDRLPSEPQTEAGRALLGYLRGEVAGLGLIGVQRGDAILAIEREAADAARTAAVAAVAQAVHKMLNDRAELGYHDDFRPYIRVRNVAIEAIQQSGEKGADR